MFDAEGGSTTDCKNRVRLAWNKWREITGVICDKKVPVKFKHKIYKTVIKPTMTYGAECWTMKKKDEMLMNKTEMRMLWWIQGVSLREHKRNEEIREAATVQPIATHLMQKRLRWYGHVRRRDESHITRTVLDMEVEGVRPRGRPKLRYMDTIKRYQEEWTDGRQHSRPQGLEIGSFQGDPLTWKSLQGGKVRSSSKYRKIADNFLKIENQTLVQLFTD